LGLIEAVRYGVGILGRWVSGRERLVVGEVDYIIGYFLRSGRGVGWRQGVFWLEIYII
jgi:hypothetical protein